MTTNMRQAAQYAEYLLQCSKQRPASLLPSPPASSSKQKSLHQKLVDLYIEESQKQPEGKELDYATHLLAKLVCREKLNCLVLNLYPANEGYSLMLKARNGVESETIKLPYEENELLDYIDAAQLPPFLVDLLEKAQVNVFYNGCVIVEVRDFRRSTTGSHDTQYVMLKPTPQSLLCDINALTNDGNRWTQEDVFQLESQLLMATEEPICLDPSPAVLLINNRIQYQQKQLNDPMLKRCVKKFTQAAVNRKRKLAQAPAPPELKLHDFIHKRKDKNRGNPPVNLKVGKTCVDMWRQRPAQLSPPESVNVEEHAKVIKLPQGPGNITLVEEHTLERDPNQERRMLAKITIHQSSNESYIGELYLDHDFSNDKTSDGRSCQFALGSRENVDKYFEQFRELFTEEGRRSVKITTQRPNQPPSVVFTQTTQSSNATSITITNAQALLKHATSLAATITTQNEPTGSAGLVAKRNMPIQLSLSLGPPGSGSINAQANIISPQSATVTVSQPSASLTTSLPSQQLTLTQTSQSLSSSQRIKPFSIHSAHSRITGTPSPVSTSTNNNPGQHQLFTAVTSSQPGSQKIPTPAPTPTPPPAARTPTPTSSTPRRTSTTESITVSQTSQSLPQTANLATYLQGLTSTAGLNVQSSTADSGTTSIAQQPNITTNINITNLGGLPQNFNIGSLAGLQGVNIANIQGLSNVQMSLTGVSMPGGGIAVPVPITMINNNPSLLQNQGILVSSLPNMAASVTSASTDSTASSTTAQANNQSTSTVTSPHSYVTMVTALPATTASSTSVTSTSMASTVVMSSGLASNSTTVLPSQSAGMLSLPYGLTAGNLAHLMPIAGVGKTSSAGSGLRAQPASASTATASLPLLQLQGQQGIQLLNLPQHRGGAQVKPGHLQSSGGPTQTSARASVTTTVPISTVLTNQQMAALTSLTVGKPGQTTTTSLTPQQLMQLTGQAGIQSSQLQTQLTFQKTQPAGAQQHLQFHPLQLKQPTAVPAPLSSSHSSHSSKSKSKKRTTPTPPKN